LQSYLLLLNRDSKISNAEQEDMDESDTPEMPEMITRCNPNKRIVSKFILTEFKKAGEHLSSQIESHFQQITVDAVRAATSFCLIGSLLLSRLQPTDFIEIGQIFDGTQLVAKQLEDILSQRDSNPAFVKAAVEVVSQHLPDSWSDTSETGPLSGEADVIKLAKRLYSAIHSRGDGSTEYTSMLDSESMEIDEYFDSQPSNREANGTESFNRDSTFEESSPAAFTRVVIAHLRLITSIAEPSSEVSQTRHVPAGFIDYAKSLNPTEIMSCRPLLKLVLDPKATINRIDAARLLIHISGTTLQEYEFERCENILLLCLDLMIGSMEMWTDPNVADDLSEIGTALHEWFLNIALGKGIASSNVLIRITDYLRRLLKVCPDVGKKTSTRSVRSSLFLVLKEGDVRVKFYVADQIPRIFKLFVLGRHDAVFDDILKNLPTAEDWLEGLALRLRVLARLAASWTTLLRKSVYRIFETPGLIPSSAPYARRCFLDLSNALEFTHPQEIFRTFAPQLLFTWMGPQSLLAIPFSIFGYRSLRDLLSDVQEELTAQLLMRGNESGMNELEQRLELSVPDLLTRAFSRSFAYSIARDISIPPTADDGISAGSELRLRKHLGKDQFLSLINEHMPNILTILVSNLEQEEQIEKSFSKDAVFHPALAAWKEMKAHSSEEVLPANQQPSFRARYLADELEHLCRRSPKALDQIWDSSTVVFVLRKLLDSIHPALGALHACSILRRVRIVIAMAGQVALQGYPLEMLLHAFRPYITEYHCADDAFGIVRYLFIHGKSYLISKPSFVAGIAVSILISLKSFMSSSPASTTQESQHQATMSRAQAFHAWFAGYLVSDDSAHFSGSTEASFGAMIKNALDVRERGNAFVGSSESNLLMELFDDQTSGRKVLAIPAQRQAISLLCKDFEGPLSYREDFLGSDEISSKHVKTIWDSCQNPVVAPQFMQWAARVLGRTYASTGDVPKALIEESSFRDLKEICRAKASAQSQSIIGIFRLIQDLLMSDRPSEAKAAEHTLQLIVSKHVALGRTSELEQFLPEEILKSMACFSIEDSMRKPSNNDFDLKSCMQLKNNMAFTQWTQKICLALMNAAPDNLTIHSLWSILTNVPGFAMSAFPLLLHMVLQQQINGKKTVGDTLSGSLTAIFQAEEISTLGHVKTILTAILYLRSQPLPHERNSADRDRWLEVDYDEAAKAAVRCKMYKTALLFYEIRTSGLDRASRRSSIVQPIVSSKFLKSVFDNIDEPDSFYGIPGDSGLVSVLSRAEHEQDGFKTLSIQGALLDCQMRNTIHSSSRDFRGVVSALSALNMNTISLSLLQNTNISTAQSNLKEDLLRTARKLEQWDIPVPPSRTSESATIFRAYQAINSTNGIISIRAMVDSLFLDTMKQMGSEISSGASLHPSLRALAAITELDEVLTCRGLEDLNATWERLQQRQSWMTAGRYVFESYCIRIQGQAYVKIGLTRWISYFLLERPCLALSHVGNPYEI
jgi:ataxia telangiectasia mutated family protein